jgi:hypothetical protein
VRSTPVEGRYRVVEAQGTCSMILVAVLANPTDIAKLGLEGQDDCFCFEMGSRYIAQAGLKLLGPSAAS